MWEPYPICDGYLPPYLHGGLWIGNDLPPCGCDLYVRTLEPYPICVVDINLYGGWISTTIFAWWTGNDFDG
jgi:hypothetical protein